MEQHIAELASIHQKVAEANRAQQENSGHLYLRALQVMCPSWHPPARKAPIPRTSQIQGMERALARHERNAWLHTLETSCLPMLYGLCHKRIPATILPPNGDYRPALSLPAPTVGLPLSRQRQVEALYNWTEKPMTGQGLEDEALCAAALTRASGNLEGLSDAVLLAWRCASEEKTNALEWYLQHRVPKLGHNELSRAALHYLSGTGHRVQTASSD